MALDARLLAVAVGVGAEAVAAAPRDAVGDSAMDVDTATVSVSNVRWISQAPKPPRRSALYPVLLLVVHA